MHALDVGRALVEEAHVLHRQELERRPVPAAVREEVDQREHGRQPLAPDGRQEVVRERGPAVWGGDGRDRQYFERAVC